MIVPAQIVPWLLLFALKASLILAAAFGVTALMRRASAASRHVVWLAAFGTVLALPVATFALPALELPLFDRVPALFRPAPGEVVEVPVTAETPVAERPVALSVRSRNQLEAAERALARAKRERDIARAERALDVQRLKTAAREPAVVDVIEVHPETPVAAEAVVAAPASFAASAWPMRVFLLWVFGCVMVAVAFAVGVLRTHIVACAALPASGDALSDEVEVLSAELGIVRDIRLVTWPGPAMPMTWGARKPVVLLPESARRWPSDRRREVLLHELAHVRRGDWLARILAAFACALHWFNPLVWMAAARLRYEQELACDDTVLSEGVVPSDYATHLLDVAKGLRVPGFAMANASVAMARPSQLTGRLLAVLDESRARVAGSPRRTVALSWLCCLPLLASVGAAAPGTRAADDVAIASLPRVVDVREPAPVAVLAGPKGGVAGGVKDGVTWAAAEVPGAPAIALALTRGDRCDEQLRRGGSNRSSTSSRSGSGAGYGYSYSTGSGSSSSSASAGSGSTATSSSRGGSTRTSSRSGSRSSSHESDDGSPKRAELMVTEGDCRLDVRMVGDVRFTDDGSDIASLSADASIRVTQEGDGPDRRFDASMRDGRLERHWRVDGTEVAETAELRAWLAMALQTAMLRTGYDAVPRALRAYRAGGLDSALVIANATNSDYSRRTIVVALLDSVRVRPADAARLARQAETMSSDYERAELLIAVANRLPLDGDVQDAMVSAAGNMSSDYERRRVLTAALANPNITSSAALSMLRSAAGMSSDYEKSELLVALAGPRPLDEAQQLAFLEVTNTYSSDYEHRRALLALIDKSQLTPAVIQKLCAQAMRMSSDYERTELLLPVARKYAGNAEARAQLARVAESYSSDYERDRLYSQLGRSSR